MRILVTGAAGFIGFNLCMELSKHHEVSGIDFYKSDPLKITRTNLLMGKCDIQQVDIMHDELPNLHNIDLVIHLAAIADVMRSISHPTDYYNVNVIGTQRIIDAVSVYNIPVIYASSSSVYSGNGCSYESPYKESDMLGMPTNPYAMSKYVNESQFKQASIQSWGLRFFTVYGDWGRPEQALWKFTESVINDTGIVLRGNGEYLRDFTHIDDLVQAIVCVIDNKPTEDIINVGSGVATSTSDMVRYISDHLETSTDISLEGYNEYESIMTLSDNSILESYGWRAHIDINDGICKFIDWYQESGYGS